MPKYGPHLPGIEKEVHDRLSHLGLKAQYVFDVSKHQERFYTVPCQNQKGGQVIFKMRTEDCPATQASFRREILINQVFLQFYKRSRKMSVPKFIDGDSRHVPEWMVYEFIPGCAAGDFYNGLHPSHLKNFPLESLVAGMKNMQKMSAFAAGEMELKAQKYEDFERAYQSSRPVLAPFFSAAQIAQGAKILRSHRELLDEKSVAIAHGDFHPGNLVITPSGKIAVIDWYYVQLNNLAFDLAFLYLEIADKKFRKKVLEKFVAEVVDDPAEFRQLFRLDILRLVPQKLSVLRDALFVLNPKQKDYYANLTPAGVAKLEANLAAFTQALAGDGFL